MAVIEPTSAETVSLASPLTLSDLRAALFAGWEDFKTHPQFGILFATLFTISGLALTYAMISLGELAWLIPAVAGFPIIAPFIAVGLYEVSRRRQENLPIRWLEVLGAVKGRGDEQILSMGVIVFVAFGFWVIVAHAISAIFLAEAGPGSENLAFLLTPQGATMLVVGSVFGGVMALGFYAITVISLPMLVDRNVDFLTAIITSLRVFRGNTAVLLVWALIIAAALLAALVFAFLGLLVVLPLLGHATWHLYRRAVRRPSDSKL